MAKKSEEIEGEKVLVAETISEVTANLGRADLNELASKLNEVIRRINA